MAFERLPLPAAHIDPAFVACLEHSAGTPELTREFDRLYGASVATGKPSRGDMRAFIGFVHRFIYLTLPDDAIEALRASHCEVAHA